MLKQSILPCEGRKTRQTSSAFQYLCYYKHSRSHYIPQHSIYIYYLPVITMIKMQNLQSVWRVYAFSNHICACGSWWQWPLLVIMEKFRHWHKYEKLALISEKSLLFSPKIFYWKYTNFHSYLKTIIYLISSSAAKNAVVLYYLSYFHISLHHRYIIFSSRWWHWAVQDNFCLKGRMLD